MIAERHENTRRGILRMQTVKFACAGCAFAFVTAIGSLLPAAATAQPSHNLPPGWQGSMSVGSMAALDLADGRTLHVDSQIIEGQAAIAGHGVAMLSPAFWQFELLTGRLVQMFDHVGRQGSFWLVYPEHKHNAAKVRAFREWLLAEAAA